MAQKQKKRPFLWVIVVLLFVGLLGFGTGGLNGTVTSIGTVGDKEISVARYQSALNEQLRAFSAQIGSPIGFQQAQALGLDQAVLNQLVTQRTLDNEAAELGLSVGDERVREAVLAVPAFRGLDGSFDRAAYAETLRRVNQTEAEFEASIRDDLSRTLVQGSVVGGIAAPTPYADAVVQYLRETRDITYAVVSVDDLTSPVPGPAETDVATFFADNGDDYMRPETRDITYVWLTPAMIQDELEVDEDALRATYDERRSEFVQPERRLVERLAFVDQAKADAAAARITDGSADFEALVAERGLDLADVDLGDVSADDLRSAGPDVFAAAPGDVVGPLNTSLGPALFRVNAVLAAEEITFEEARADLREELATLRAQRVIDQASEGINDLMAGGATMEDLAAQTDLELGTIAFSANTTDGIAAYDNFRDAATTAQQGAFADLLPLSDGGIFALRLDGVTPPEQENLDDVRADVIADWQAARAQELVLEQANSLADQISPLTGLDTLGLNAIETDNLLRNSFVEGTQRGFMTSVYDMTIAEVRVIDNGDTAVIVRLDNIASPDPDAADTGAATTQVLEAATGGIAQDLFEAYAAAVRTQTDVQINQATLNALHAQFQ